MLKITINGKAKEIKRSESLHDVLLQEQEIQSPYAVAVNMQFVAKDEYKNFQLDDGDQIDIVTPMQGG